MILDCRIVGYLSWDSPIEGLNESESVEDTIIRIRIEAANIIASLAHGRSFHIVIKSVS